jgi:hypothetical protein
MGFSSRGKWLFLLLDLEGCDFVALDGLYDGVAQGMTGEIESGLMRKGTGVRLVTYIYDFGRKKTVYWERLVG